MPVAVERAEYEAPAAGFIQAIDSLEVGMAAIDTGAGRRRKEDAIAYGSGFTFRANVGDRVHRGQVIVTVHSDRPDRTADVLARLGAAIRIGPRPVAKPRMVLHIVDKDGARLWTHS